MLADVHSSLDAEDVTHGRSLAEELLTRMPLDEAVAWLERELERAIAWDMRALVLAHLTDASVAT